MPSHRTRVLSAEINATAEAFLRSAMRSNDEDKRAITQVMWESKIGKVAEILKGNTKKLHPIAVMCETSIRN